MRRYFVKGDFYRISRFCECKTEEIPCGSQDSIILIKRRINFLRRKFADGINPFPGEQDIIYSIRRVFDSLSFTLPGYISIKSTYAMQGKGKNVAKFATKKG